MPKPTATLAPLDTFRPQAANANAHTARGHAALEMSVQADGWIGAQTAAADGEIFDGSDRQEVGVTAGFDEAIVVESDGTRPVVVVRTDIPTATDPRAKRLALAANRVAELNLAWDAAQLAALQAEDAALLAGLWRDDELAALLPEATPEPGAGGDEFDATPAPGPTRTQVGDVWQLGAHRLAVNDSTEGLTITQLMNGAKAAATITDPPFMVRDDKWDVFKSLADFSDFTGRWLVNAYAYSNVVACFFADKYVPLLREVAAQHDIPYRRHLVWRKPPGSQFAGAALDGFWFDFELITVFGVPQFKPDKHTKMAVLEYRTVTDQEHGCEKPVDLLIDIITGYSQLGDIILDPFVGTGTGIVAGHRAGRVVYACEKEPRTADVVLRRAEAEGIGPIELVSRG